MNNKSPLWPRLRLCANILRALAIGKSVLVISPEIECLAVKQNEQGKWMRCYVVDDMIPVPYYAALWGAITGTILQCYYRHPETT